MTIVLQGFAATLDIQIKTLDNISTNEQRQNRTFHKAVGQQERVIRKHNRNCHAFGGCQQASIPKTIHLGLGLHNHGVSDASVKANLAICTVPRSASYCEASCSVRCHSEGKDKGGFKRIGNVYLGEEQTQENDWWSEEASVWCGPVARKAAKAFRKERTKILKAILVLFLKKKVQTRICNQTKERVKIRGEKRKRKFLFSMRTFCIRIAK